MGLGKDRGWDENQGINNDKKEEIFHITILRKIRSTICLITRKGTFLFLSDFIDLSGNC